MSHATFCFLVHRSYKIINKRKASNMLLINSKEHSVWNTNQEVLDVIDRRSWCFWMNHLGGLNLIGRIAPGKIFGESAIEVIVKVVRKLEMVRLNLTNVSKADLQSISLSRCCECYQNRRSNFI